MLSFNRNQWEAYVGLSQTEVQSLFRQVLTKKNIPFTEKECPPVYMYDNSHNSLAIETEELSIRLIYVSGDPLTRFFSNIVGSKKHFQGVTFLTIKHQGATNSMQEVISDVNRLCQVKPWMITHHPRFQFAYLLQAINRYKWRKVCN